MSFIEKMFDQARKDKKTIVLPEPMDKRTYEAAEKIVKLDIANVVIIGTPEEIEKNGAGFDLSGVTFVDPFNDPNKQKYIDKFVELRGKKGVTPESAKEQMEKDYMYYACLMCKCGDADGAVSGACHSTGNTIRPALQLLKTKPGISGVSGFFVMEVPDCTLGENGLFLFADCAVNPDMDEDKMAEIAGLSAESFEAFVGGQAKVALLSFSTKGSASNDRVTMVANAAAKAQERFPQYMIDGELQLDAALVPEVGQLKAPESKVAGNANTLVFPDLESGNIGYKLVQRLAKANAYGPILQGLSLPVNDLSRGCFADDIVGTVAITAVQAQIAAK
ncbi:MAG: phosphate acetyltransferase [Lachnospiraceae bacterium]|nr:phosphate acetyltransferase [Lachnospiraceae bacterium]